jgi:hypothetical protein
MVRALNASRVPNPVAATWRDPSFKPIATSDARTMCYFPRRPGRLRAVRDGFTSVLRCRDCPGCYEFDRRRLAARLQAHYQNFTAQLWCARIRAPAEDHSRLSRNLHRRSALALEPGLYRCGPSSFQVLGRDEKLLRAALSELERPFRLWRVRLGRGRATWSRLTAGLLVSRAQYGEQTKRWYVAGLKPAEKLTWNIDRIPYEKGYDPRSSPRAWSEGELALVPPAAWALRPRDRRTVRNMYAHASDPESVAAVMQVVATVAASLQSPVNRSERPLLSRAAVAAHYAEMSRRRQVVSDAARAATDEKIDRPAEGGRYASSVLVDNRAPPKLLSESELNANTSAGLPVWIEREHKDRTARGQADAAKRARTQSWIEEWAERMRSKLKGGPKDGS